MAGQLSALRKRNSVEDLIESGVYAIASRGIDHVSVLDVVTQSGVSRPTFYTYFGDLNGFYAEVWLHYGGQWLDEQLAITGQLSPEVDRALLEIFAVARRIPEVLEVVQPEIEAWWHKRVSGNPVVAQNVAWKLASVLGYKMSLPVSSKVKLGQELCDAFVLPDDALMNPILANLPKRQDEIAGLEGLVFDGASVEEVLTASAIEVIANSGYGAASITRIARKARVSTGSIYPRYKSLDNLIHESFEKTIVQIVEGNVDRFSVEGYNLADYGISIAAGLAPSRAVWRNYRTEMHLEAAQSPELASYLSKGFDKAAGALEELALDWGLPKPQATQLAWYLHAMAMGMAVIFGALPLLAEQDFRLMTVWVGKNLHDTFATK